MTIQATLTTLILSVFLVSNTVGLPSADQTAPMEASVSVQLEAEAPSFPGMSPRLPIERVAQQLAANPSWGIALLTETPSLMTRQVVSKASAGSHAAQAPVKRIPGRGAWLDAQGQPLPFQSDEAIIEYLETARVVSSKRTGEGTNGAQKVLLEKDGVEMHGVFRDWSVHRSRLEMDNGTLQLNFRDDCIFELAAYRLSRILGLDNVPPVTRRTLGRNKGTIQIWVENALMEKKRAQDKIQTPNRVQWVYQKQLMYLFDNLIENDDRNQGNILFDSSWKVWLIDHTRAFRYSRKLPSPEMVRYCPRTVWEGLKRLDKDLLEEELKGTLGQAEIRALLARRDLLVAHLQNLIDDKGEAGVLF